MDETNNFIDIKYGENLKVGEMIINAGIDIDNIDSLTLKYGKNR